MKTIATTLAALVLALCLSGCGAAIVAAIIAIDLATLEEQADAAQRRRMDKLTEEQAQKLVECVQHLEPDADAMKRTIDICLALAEKTANEEL